MEKAESQEQVLQSTEESGLSKDHLSALRTALPSQAYFIKYPSPTYWSLFFLGNENFNIYFAGRVLAL